jgi:hypothetical protein
MRLRLIRPADRKLASRRPPVWDGPGARSPGHTMTLGRGDLGTESRDLRSRRANVGRKLKGITLLAQRPQRGASSRNRMRDPTRSFWTGFPEGMEGL